MASALPEAAPAAAAWAVSSWSSCRAGGEHQVAVTARLSAKPGGHPRPRPCSHTQGLSGPTRTRTRTLRKRGPAHTHARMVARRRGTGAGGDPLNQWALEALTPRSSRRSGLTSAVPHPVSLCSSLSEVSCSPGSGSLQNLLLARKPLPWILLLWAAGQVWGTQAKTETSHPPGHPGGVRSTRRAFRVLPPPSLP